MAGSRSQRSRLTSRFYYFDSFTLCHTCFLRLAVLAAVLFTPGLGNNAPKLETDKFRTTLVVPESTPIGTVIGNITASDPDGQSLVFKIETASTNDLVELSAPRVIAGTPPLTVVDIILKEKLDRDYAPNRRTLYFSVSDGFSSIPFWITLFISDVNDVAPQFVNLPYEVTISENTQPDTVIFTGVLAKDPDNGRGVSYSMEARIENADPEYANTFDINMYNGNISLKYPLDYEKHSYYQFKIMAEDDGGLTAEPAGFVVYVTDVQDTPPLFVNLPYSTVIDEDTPVDTSIQKVVAIDGDTGVPNSITYSFIEGDYENFNIDAFTGDITIKKALDRDSDAIRNSGGVYAMTVQASEVIPPNQVNLGETTATTLVTITVKDVNDNGPEFTAARYEAKILENMQQGVPVAFQGPIMRVADIDQGTNSHFELTFEKDGKPFYDFAPLPQEIYSESSVLIRVNNSKALDYEVNQQVVFTVVARELDTDNPKSSSATVTIDIEDMNDNAPVFQPPDFTLDMYENTPIGTSLDEFKATDKDSGAFGAITYSLRGGNGKFAIEPDTGILRVTGNIDREENPQFYLTVEARDGGGLRTPAEVVITVKDKNDNNPVFRRDDYEGIVREGEANFVRPLKVEAVDEDESNTPNSDVSYRIANAPPGLLQNFTINNKTGEITLTQPLDYEKLDPSLRGKVVLTVEAFDAGNPQGVSSVFVNITVEDQNDFTPRFTQDEYFSSIPENAGDGFVVKRVQATDLDATSPNKDFIYRIESGALDKFRINFETGEVEVEKRANLDRESRDEYTLTISAIDRGTPPLTGYCTLKITLTDVNDEGPVFDPPTASTDLSENTALDVTFYDFVATDADLNATLKYTLQDVHAFKSARSDVTLDIVATGVQNYFDINPATGGVYVKSKLDRETAEKVTLQIVVEDMNAQEGEQTATGTLTVSILDYNDNAPEFIPSSNYSVNVSEADGINSIVLQVSTRDIDDNQIVSYNIGSASVDAFIISSDGTVRLKNRLDREREKNAIFEVIARDNGSPSLRSTATVSVSVLDDNDNAPEFDPSHGTSFEVSEDAPLGFLVTTITASDRDDGDYGTIHYTLAGPDTDDGSFVIDEDTGAITVAKQLDRETKAVYRFEVVATDSLKTPEDSKSVRSNPITITIKDVNDNPPLFVLVSPEFPQVSESSALDQTVATITAEDADDPDTGNGVIIFSLTSDTNATLDDGRPMFKINRNTGIISTANSLDGNAGIFYITVQLTNVDETYKPTLQIYLKVIDVNDDIPRFRQPNQDYFTVSVVENAPLGTVVYRLIAEDDDQGLNGEILYSIQPLPNNELDGSRTFSVDAVTGVIVTNGTINAESQLKYELEVKASDQGFPTPYSTTLILVVEVLDQNDHEPKFYDMDAPHKISMPENSLEACVDINLAIDLDVNSEFICYYLISSDLLDTFELRDKTRSLCLLKTLDRETKSKINVVIRAASLCDLNPTVAQLQMGENNQPVLFDPATQDTLWLEIEVADINDNAPKFKSKDLALGVTRVTQFGKAILNLTDSVEDQDTSIWGIDYFKRTTPFKAHPKALEDELSGLGVQQPFILTRDGLVKTNVYFKPQMSGFFTVGLEVFDKGGLSDTATLRISLINDDQRLIIIFRQPIDKIGPVKDIIAQKLSQKIGYRIVVDSLQTHETESGQADLAKTDMFIHGEDFETNEVVPAERLLSLIDQKNAMLNEILNEYNVLQIILTEKKDLDDGMEDKLKMALILVTVVLGTICVTLAIVLYYTYSRYERKLKAATAMAYEPNDSDLYKGDIPGTNIHSYENANPIFLEKMMSASQDDGLDDNGFVSESTFDEQEVTLNIPSPTLDLDHNRMMNKSEAYLSAVLTQHHADIEETDLDALENDEEITSHRGGDSGLEETPPISTMNSNSIHPHFYASKSDSTSWEPKPLNKMKKGKGGKAKKTSFARNGGLSAANQSKQLNNGQLHNHNGDGRGAEGSDSQSNCSEENGDVKRMNSFGAGASNHQPFGGRHSSPAYLDFRNGLNAHEDQGQVVILTDL